MDEIYKPTILFTADTHSKKNISLPVCIAQLTDSAIGCHHFQKFETFDDILYLIFEENFKRIPIGNSDACSLGVYSPFLGLKCARPFRGPDHSVLGISSYFYIFRNGHLKISLASIRNIRVSVKNHISLTVLTDYFSCCWW